MSREPFVDDESTRKDLIRTINQSNRPLLEVAIVAIRNAYCTGFYEGHKAGCEDTAKREDVEEYPDAEWVADMRRSIEPAPAIGNGFSEGHKAGCEDTAKAEQKECPHPADCTCIGCAGIQ